MKLFLDTNIILDIILRRKSFFEDAGRLLTLAETQKIQLFISSITIVNANYIACKFADKQKVIERLKVLRLVCDVIEVSKNEIDKALYSDFTDFEDAVQYYSALKNNCNYIITRDRKDFKNSEITVMTPQEFLVSYKTNKL